MLSGITILCFAGSYSVALVLEVTRLFFKSGVRGAVMLGFAAAGLVAHAVFLLERAWLTEGAPLSSTFDWYLMAAWILAAGYLYLVYYHPRDLIGLFLLPLVLGLIAAAQFADRTPVAEQSALRGWGVAHGSFLLAGTVAVSVGFVSGLMYLIQAWRLKHKMRPAEGIRLPSLEWLDRVNTRAVRLSAVLIGAGFLSGLVLYRIKNRAAGAPAWEDPVVWSLAAMFLWLLAASLFNMLYKPARHGRKVAYLTVASFLFLILALGSFLFDDTVHRPVAAVGNVEVSLGAAPGPARSRAASNVGGSLVATCPGGQS